METSGGQLELEKKLVYLRGDTGLYCAGAKQSSSEANRGRSTKRDHEGGYASLCFDTVRRDGGGPVVNTPLTHRVWRKGPAVK